MFTFPSSARVASCVTTLTAVAATALLSGCVTTDMQMGNAAAKTVATGSAAGATSTKSNSALEKCSASQGTVSLIENQSAG